MLPTPTLAHFKAHEWLHKSVRRFKDKKRVDAGPEKTAHDCSDDRLEVGKDGREIEILENRMLVNS